MIIKYNAISNFIYWTNIFQGLFISLKSSG